MGHSHQGSRRQGQLEPQRECFAVARNVRFGSLADMCSALGDVCFVPIADSRS